MVCSAEEQLSSLCISPQLRVSIWREIMALAVEYEDTTDPARRARLERQVAALRSLLDTHEERRRAAPPYSLSPRS